MVLSVVRKAYYDTPEGQVHYRYVSSSLKDASKAPILFLHMSATSSHYYENLMQLCAAGGYDCYAPDMPGLVYFLCFGALQWLWNIQSPKRSSTNTIDFSFGRSFDLPDQPAGINYYVESFMILIELVGISKFHVFGHHSGASIAIEMAATFPDQIISLIVSSPALCNREEQMEFEKTELVTYNKPVDDGTQWNKTWDYINSVNTWDLNQLNDLTLDATRAWQGRIQIYTCVFSQPVIELFGRTKCPVLALSSVDGVLHKYMSRVKEIKPNATVKTVEGGDFEVLLDAAAVCGHVVHFIENN